MKFVCLRYPKFEMTYKAEIRREVNGVILKEPTKLIRFENGSYITDDKEEIAFIKKHTYFGLLIVEDESERIQKEVIEKQKAEIREELKKEIAEGASTETGMAPEPKRRGRKKKVI